MSGRLPSAVDIATRLQARPCGHGWLARCPAHEDEHPSLKIDEQDGKVLLFCHRGCTFEEITAALAVSAAAPARPSTDVRRHDATYVYRDMDGRVVLTVTRWRTEAGKDFSRSPLNVKAATVPPYRLPELSGAAQVWIVEGEKDVDRLAALGLAATCNASGARKWLPVHTEQVLRAVAPAAEIIVIPDEDEPGQQHARSIASAFTARGRVVRVVRLPFGDTTPKGADVSDWLNLGGTLSELQDLAAATRAWSLEASEPAPDSDDGAGLVVRRADCITPRPISFVWQGRIARGKTTLIAGHPGTGKSQLTCAIAAAVTTGAPFPDGTLAPLGRVVMLSAEDEAEDTIVPRLMAAGADTSRVELVAAVRDVSADGALRERGLHLDRDVAKLDELLTRLGDVVLVTVDPITAYMGGVKTNDGVDVRAMLAPLERVAQRHRVAILCVSHLNKNGVGEAITRVSGSLAFVAAARSAFLVVRDPDNEARRLMLSAKQNLAAEPPGIAYEVVGVTLSNGIGTSRVEWLDGTVDARADDVLAATANPHARSKAREAEDWLRERLSEGPRLRPELQADAAAQGLGWRTVQRVAAAIGVEMAPSDFGGPFLWKLPVAPSPAQLRQLSDVAQLGADGATGPPDPFSCPAAPVISSADLDTNSHAVEGEDDAVSL